MSERYRPAGKPLTPYERELLTILAEEANEVAIAAIKLIRFGRESRPPERTTSNTTELGLEIGDLEWMITLASVEGLANEPDIKAGMARKRERLAYFMQTTKSP